MRTTKRTGFLRHFIGGFALGAMALVGVQLTHNVDAPMPMDHSQSAVVTPVG